MVFILHLLEKICVNVYEYSGGRLTDERFWDIRYESSLWCVCVDGKTELAGWSKTREKLELYKTRRGFVFPSFELFIGYRWQVGYGAMETIVDWGGRWSYQCVCV